MTQYILINARFNNDCILGPTALLIEASPDWVRMMQARAGLASALACMDDLFSCLTYESNDGVFINLCDESLKLGIERNNFIALDQRPDYVPYEAVELDNYTVRFASASMLVFAENMDGEGQTQTVSIDPQDIVKAIAH